MYLKHYKFGGRTCFTNAAKIHFGGLDMEVEFYYQPFEPGDREYPGCPAAIEIEGINVHGDEVDMEMFTDKAMQGIQRAIQDDMNRDAEALAQESADLYYHDKRWGT